MTHDPNEKIHQAGRTLLISLLLPPVSVVLAALSWWTMDFLLSFYEVTQFVRDHQSLVARRLTDPKVHAFAIRRDPNHPSMLRIEFTVDDKATFLMLENDLRGASDLRNPAIWDYTVLSREDLGNNFGPAFHAFRGMMEFVLVVLSVLGLSLIASVANLILGLRRIRSLPEPFPQPPPLPRYRSRFGSPPSSPPSTH